jgi:O-antigen ligase
MSSEAIEGMTGGSPAAASSSRAARLAEVSTPLKPVRTLASRFIILVLFLAVILSTLAFGTVHSWSLLFFHLGAGIILLLWTIDAWRSRVLRFSRNPIQLPLLGLILLGLIQLFPFGSAAQSLSFDPYATRGIVIIAVSLFVYFAAALAFIDSPQRLRLAARVIIVFGVMLAIGSLVQSFVSPTKIYGIREPLYSIPFGPFINRHHFAAYMALAIGVQLGLLAAGAANRDRIPLYAFAVLVMSIALVMTGSRGGVLSFIAEIFFIVVLSRVGASRSNSEREQTGKDGMLRALLPRVAIGLAIVLMLLFATLFFGGEESLSRLLGTVNADNPTSGRTQFWATTLEMIRHHPLLGVGLGAFGAVYTRYDPTNGAWRVEQAHNDYLQVLADGGVVGAALGLFFIVWLFRTGFARAASGDKFRRAVALGALGGCFAALVHSMFDFTLHTTSNALLFLVLAALATTNNSVEDPKATGGRKRKHRRRRHRGPSQPASAHDDEKFADAEETVEKPSQTVKV